MDDFQTFCMSMAAMFVAIAIIFGLVRGCEIQRDKFKSCVEQHSPLECKAAIQN